MRINKFFSNLGICSRKETNKFIEEGRIKVNGKSAILGQWIDEDDRILLDDKPVLMQKKIYIAFNKPVGVICTTDKSVKENIIEFLNYPQYIFPVGRLDKESQGLIIMTNDGELANAILDSENYHEKEYIVTLDKTFDDKFLEKMSQGVEINVDESTGIKRVSDNLGIRIIDDKKEYIAFGDKSSRLNDIRNSKNKIVKTRPCEVKRINSNTFRIILTQGMNKQIRKMSGALGYRVIKLERIRIINISLQGIIKPGEWREISNDEINNLRKANNKIEYLFIDRDSELYNLAIELRYKEFYEKFNRTRDSIFDEVEDKSLRIVACTNSKVIGHARLYVEGVSGEITQVVVDKDYRGLKIGANIMKRLIEEGKKFGVKKIGLDARVYAIDFYKILGFEITSEIFNSKKTGLPHVRMEILL